MENIITINVIDRDGNARIIEAPTDINLNLMEALKINTLPVDGTCGGMALCASCHIYIREGNIEKAIGNDEQIMLDDVWNTRPNSRLACQIPVTESLNNIIIELAPELVENNDDEW
jgi:ferredoxin-2, mitochondrial